MESIERPRNVLTELQQRPVEDAQACQRGLAAPFGLCCLNVRADGNIGMMIRSACTLGAEEVIICGRRHFDARFSVGAEHYVPISYWPDALKVTIDHNQNATCRYDPDEFLSACVKGRWTPVFIEQGPESKDIRAIQWPERPLLVMGNESTGIPQDFMDAIGGTIATIPQWSVLRSMNVAAAATIAMWEVRNKAPKSI